MIKEMITLIVKTNLKKIEDIKFQPETHYRSVDITNMDVSEIQNEIKKNNVPDSADIEFNERNERNEFSVLLKWYEFRELSCDEMHNIKINRLNERILDNIHDNLDILGYTRTKTPISNERMITSLDVDIDSLCAYFKTLYELID